MGLGELCEPMQTCNCSNPIKKDPLLLESFYGAASWNMLQPLAQIVAQEMKNISIEEIRCYV